MDQNFKLTFLKNWSEYFGGADLPLAFFYADDPGTAALANIPGKHRCFIGELAIVRKGKPLAWNVKSLSCEGARRYLGYTTHMRSDFEYFLSTGIPGKMEGERYIRTPEMVKEIMEHMPCVPALGRYIIFKRFDQLTPADDPIAVIFFAKPDVLSGLFTLANFDRTDGLGVIAPFGSGCGSIVHQAYFQQQSDDPKAVLGMFDASARPFVPAEMLSFSIPMKKFVKMVSYMDESFLTTGTWKTMKKRIGQAE